MQLLRWTLSIVMLVAALGFLYASAFHAWAGLGPPSPNPESHIRWSNRFFWLAMLSIAGTIVAMWKPRRKAP